MTTTTTTTTRANDKTKTRSRAMGLLFCASVFTAGTIAIFGCSTKAPEPSTEQASTIIMEGETLDLGCPSCEDGTCDTATTSEPSPYEFTTTDGTAVDPGLAQAAGIKLQNLKLQGVFKTINDCCEKIPKQVQVCGKVLVMCAALMQNCLTEGTPAYQICKVMVDSTKPIEIKNKIDQYLCSACKSDNAAECAIDAGKDAKK